MRKNVILNTLTGALVLFAVFWIFRPGAKTIELDVVQPVNPAFFIEDNLVEPI